MGCLTERFQLRLTRQTRAVDTSAASASARTIAPAPAANPVRRTPPLTLHADASAGIDDVIASVRTRAQARCVAPGEQPCTTGFHQGRPDQYSQPPTTRSRASQRWSPKPPKQCRRKRTPTGGGGTRGDRSIGAAPQAEAVSPSRLRWVDDVEAVQARQMGRASEAIPLPYRSSTEAAEFWRFRAGNTRDAQALPVTLRGHSRQARCVPPNG
jgi:hypothetical protein